MDTSFILGIIAIFIFVLAILYFLTQFFNHLESESARKRANNEGVIEKQPTMEKHTQTTEESSVLNPKYNKLSIIGLALSIIAIFGVGLAGIAGFILGIVALTQIKQTNEEGKWLAIAAITIGLIWSFVVGILKRFIEAGL